MSTISQRISIEGGDEIRKQLEALAKAAAAAFAQIQGAVEKIEVDPRTEQAFADLAAAGSKLAQQFGGLAEAASGAGPEIAETGKAAETAAEGFAKLGDATKGVAASTEKTSAGYADLALNVVRTGAAVGSTVAGITSAGAATATLGVQTVTAAAAVGTFALGLGSTLVAAIGVAVGALGVLGAALERVAFADARLANTLDHLALTTRGIGQSFKSLQVGQAAFQQIGINAEKFRSVVANIAKELATFKAGEVIEASAKQIVDATNKVLVAEKALLEAQIQREGVGLRVPSAAQQRVLEITEQLKKSTDSLAEAEKALAKTRESEAKAFAGDLIKIVELVQQIEAGSKTITFDPLTTAETKINAIKIRLQDVAKASGDVSKSLLNIIANLPKAEAFKVGAEFGLSETDVDRVRRYGAGLTKIDNLYAKIQGAGVLISPETAATFGQMDESTQRLASAWERLKQAWASTIFSGLAAGATTAFNNITARVVEFAAQVVESFNKLSGQLFTTLGQIASGWGTIFSMAGQGWLRVFDMIGSGMASLGQRIAAFVTTPIGGAWQWIVDTFNSALASLQGALAGATAAITAFVTTPVANAWQWIKDTFQSVIKSIMGSAGGGAAGGAVGAQGLAGGGWVGGRGTGTSDSNLAWLSRGEFVVPARAVAQPGVLRLLEALRRSGGNLRNVLDGMGKFAFGGMVRTPIAIPAFAAGGGMNNVTINFPGLPEITGLRASSAVVDELCKAAALAQIRSGGRKPSRYS